ncbi:transketolase [Thermogymnomonas acidicola]|uniref:Transketolase n=1 Tax=Thermogymnomonas acidicola TaxID=399579 RepID=A0AA37BSD1_9ARCH|nr:transketolase [Thermogymnomonas acidicola]GGM74635.1 transketolase [Thermogymnomonas acidicola]
MADNSQVYEYSVEDLKRVATRIRRHIIEMVYSAKSGHPGGSLSITDVLTVLYFREMRIDPQNPDDPRRDRLIMSKGHASPALYATLAVRGFFPEELLTGFRKLNSKLEGHVHRGVPGVEASTGSLGQGLGIGIGMGLAARLNNLDYHVYVILGDGEIQEGNVWESLMAGFKYRVSNVTAILDRNGVQLDGFTKDVMPVNDIKAMVEGFGWKVLEIDGHNYDQIISAIEFCKSYRDGPTFIIANTVKGKGVSYMENNPKYHGSPPANEEEYRKALSELTLEGA